MFRTILVLLFVIFSVFFIIVSGVLDFPKGKYYNCGMAEISPDFPVDVRDECRKLRG